MERLETRCKQLLDHLKEMRQYREIGEATESHFLENSLSQRLRMDLSYDRLSGGGRGGDGNDDDHHHHLH